MFIKHAHSYGSISRAVNYLLGPVDSMNRIREKIHLVRGEPDLIVSIVKRLNFKKTYDSVVAAFAPGDKVSSKVINEFIDNFIDLSFPGMKDRIAFLAVLHGNATSSHLHILVARVDLATGLQLSTSGFGLRPAQQLCSLFNLGYGWADPKDHFRKRLASWFFEARIQKTVQDQHLPVGTEIHGYARGLGLAAVLENRVKSQQDMAKVMGSFGRVVDTGLYSITVDVPGLQPWGPARNRTVKLTGVLYAQKFCRKTILELLYPTPTPRQSWRRHSDAEDKIKVEEIRTEILKKRLERKALLEKRYEAKPFRGKRSRITWFTVADNAGKVSEIKNYTRKNNPFALEENSIKGKISGNNIASEHHQLHSRGSKSAFDRERTEICRKLFEECISEVGSELPSRLNRVIQQSVESILQRTIDRGFDTYFENTIRDLDNENNDTISRIFRTSSEGKNSRSHLRILPR
ncbi:MAG: hypothetical protein EOP06_04365 [Proteobacteria bacterium]|nr:MAG: hypothetical protein EOP06_04365 [Pseudomonadota bacterium]